MQGPRALGCSLACLLPKEEGQGLSQSPGISSLRDPSLPRWKYSHVEDSSRILGAGSQQQTSLIVGTISDTHKNTMRRYKNCT